MSKCDHDDVTVAVLNERGYDDDVLLACLCCQYDEILLLKAAMQEFVTKCDEGHIISRYTYNKFKGLLND